MAEEEIKSGQELLNVDEKGNYIENKKEEKEDKPSNAYKYGLIVIAFIILLGLCCFFFYKKTNNKSLFDETKLKNLKLKSRIFYGPIIDPPFKEGKVTEEGIKKYETLVKNNISLIIPEGMMVGDYSPLLGTEILRIDSDEFIEDYKKLTDIVHKYNSYIFVQLNHPGLASKSDIIYSPSENKGFSSNVTSKEMTKEDILRIQNDFVQGAIRGKKAGFDGIDIHGAQLNFASLFLSTKYNRRTDEYGGSVENRARFIVELIKKIREAIGNDMIISIKIDSEDEDQGFTESNFLKTGKILEEAGVDMIFVSGTNVFRKGELLFYERTKKLAEILKIPVVCIGGIKSYENADYVLKNSKIEYVAMARPLMKDPELVSKWIQKNNLSK